MTYVAIQQFCKKKKKKKLAKPLAHYFYFSSVRENPQLEQLAYLRYIHLIRMSISYLGYILNSLYILLIRKYANQEIYSLEYGKYSWECCVTCSTSTLIDHILINAPSRVLQKGVINVGVSDHQLIFYTQKISRIKTGGAHKYLNFCSIKNYTADYYKEALH